MVNREDILKSALSLTTGDRRKAYGDPFDNHLRIAKLWSVILDTKEEIQPYQVALCMAALKVARLIETPNHEDSYIDGAAYMAIAGEIVNKGVKDE